MITSGMSMGNFGFEEKPENINLGYLLMTFTDIHMSRNIHTLMICHGYQKRKL